MKNIEDDGAETHLFIALRRNKDNIEDKKSICFLEICIDHATDLERIKCRIKTVPGTWRIHKTVNTRSKARAGKLLMKKLIDCPWMSEKLISLWKTCLLNSSCKADRKFLLDIDSKRAIKKVDKIINEHNIHVFETVSTPSGGMHYVVETCDTRLFSSIPDVEIKRDAYIFIEQVFIQ